MKEKCRLKSKNLWKDDEYRKKISKRRKNTWKNLAYRANQSKIHAGENNPSSKLTNVDVILIRKLWEIGFSYLQLHNEFKISGRQIKRIVFRESWRHVA